MTKSEMAQACLGFVVSVAVMVSLVGGFHHTLVTVGVLK